MDRVYQNFNELNKESALFLRIKKRSESPRRRKLAMGKLDKFLLKWVGNVQSGVDLTPNDWPNDRHPVIIVESLHHSKKLKECIVSYVSFL